MTEATVTRWAVAFVLSRVPSSRLLVLTRTCHTSDADATGTSLNPDCSAFLASHAAWRGSYLISTRFPLRRLPSVPDFVLSLLVGLALRRNLSVCPSRRVSYALNWTRLSCHKFVANQVRLGLFILAYNLGNFFRRLALPEAIKRWSLTSIQRRLIKTGGRLVRHARRLVFHLAEVMVNRDMFGEMLERIGRLRFNPG